jgi:hypothetical protein
MMLHILLFSALAVLLSKPQSARPPGSTLSSAGTPRRVRLQPGCCGTHGCASLRSAPPLDREGGGVGGHPHDPPARGCRLLHLRLRLAPSVARTSCREIGSASVPSFRGSHDEAIPSMPPPRWQTRSPTGRARGSPEAPRRRRTGRRRGALRTEPALLRRRGRGRYA